MVTAEQLHAIMPGLSDARGRELMPFLQSAMTEFSVDRPTREAAFLAQVAHESGQFQFMEEIWGPTAAQKRYEPVTDLSTELGNTEVGDGKRFKGRGPIQITGRSNYGRFGGLLGLDLVTSPESAARPEIGFRIAGLFWSKKGLNELADLATADSFKLITKRINGGFRGLAERERFYAAARAALGVPEASVPRGRARSGSLPAAPVDVEFPRGYEAIQRLGRPKKRARKTAPARRKRVPVKKRKVTSARRPRRAAVKAKRSRSKAKR